MEIDKLKVIDIYNYNSFAITIDTKEINKVIEPMRNGEPTIEQITPLEVKSINNKGRIFKDGLLFFNKELEKEIYEDWIRIPDWENIMRNEEIEEVLITNSMDGLEKIIKNESPLFFDRVRSIQIQLQNKGSYDISYRILTTLEKRYEEIKNKIYKTKIDLSNKKSEDNIKRSEVNTLKKQNEEMQKQMEMMQKQMAEFMKQSNQTEKVDDKKSEEIVENKTDEENTDSSMPRNNRRNSKS